MSKFIDYFRNKFNKKEESVDTQPVDAVPFKLCAEMRADDKEVALATGNVCVEIIEPVEPTSHGKMKKRKCYIKATTQAEFEEKLKKFATKLCDEWGIGLQHVLYKVSPAQKIKQS